MILRRVIEHFRKQEWTAIGIDFAIVVIGVFVGIQVANWNESRIEQARSNQILDAFRADLNAYLRFSDTFGDRVAKGLAEFDAARARGEKPAPYFIRTRGSDMPPRSVWEVAQQSGLADLMHPSLMVEIGFFYSEVEGIGVKFVRYSEFVNERILPRLDDPSAFYDENGELKPAYRQNMQRLREWVEDSAVNAISARCLLGRFEKAKSPGTSCRSDYGTFDDRKSAP